MRDRGFWLAWAQISGVGAVLRKRLCQQFKQMEIAWDIDGERLQSVEGIGPKLAQAIVEQRQRIDVDHLLDEYLQTNPHWLTPADPDYPQILWEIPDPPALLHYVGNLELLRAADSGKLVAIVGTRKITAYGTRWTQRLSRTLSQHGCTIVSGLAAGVDTEAHQSCLAVGGNTIGVLGTGLDVVYPRSNAKLYQQIAAVGLILSEYPAGTPADRRHFPERNRIVAGLSKATIVTEAGRQSGALITARQATEYGRPVHVLAGSLDNLEAAGGLQLIHEGAQIITSEANLLESVGAVSSSDQLDLFAAPTPTAVAQLSVDLTPTQQQIWQVIAASAEPVLLDTIVETTGFATGEVLSNLLEMELLGAVSEQAGMRYQVV